MSNKSEKYRNVELFSNEPVGSNPNLWQVEFRCNAIVENLQQDIEGKDVLDLGLGYGLIHRRLAACAKSYDIVEGSHVLVERFRQDEKDIPYLKIFCSYFEEFQTDKLYDYIIMAGVLELLENPVDVIKKYSYNLKPTGTLVVSVYNAESLNRRIGYEAGILNDIYHLNQTQIDRGWKRYYTLSSMKHDLKMSSFEVVKAEGIFLKPVTDEQMKTLKFDSSIYTALVKIGKQYPELCWAFYMECIKRIDGA